MLIRLLLTPTQVVKLMNTTLINFQQHAICDHYYHYCCYYSMFLQTASCTHAHGLASYMFWNDCHQILVTLTGAGVILFCVYMFSTETTEQNRRKTHSKQMPCPSTKPLLINYKIPKYSVGGVKGFPKFSPQCSVHGALSLHNSTFYVLLVLFALNVYARHEGKWREKGHSSTHFEPRRQMQVRKLTFTPCCTARKRTPNTH